MPGKLLPSFITLGGCLFKLELNLLVLLSQYGSFTRSFTLPDGADLGNTKSELKDGVLTLVIPKQPGVQPKKIAIGAGTPRS